MKKIVFSGKAFIKKNKRGVQRYTCEIIMALDKYITDEDVIVLIPNVKVELPELKNIKFIKYGGNITVKGWQYLAYQYYIKKYKALSVSLSADVAPLFEPGIVAIHDMAVINEKKFFKSIKNRLLFWKKYLKHKYVLFIYYIITKKAKHIITVSDFSRKEIIKYYNYKKQISVIYNAWEHLKKVNINEKVLEKKYCHLLKKDFYFFLGGQDRYKNIKWICKMAEKYKERLFVMAGPPIDNSNLKDNDININDISNIVYLGYIKDEEMGFFMKKCKAFLFPSLYEGFGIPPLEALYFKAKVLCSNSACLPEIYKNYVVYFDPYDYDVDLDKLEKVKVDNVNEIFKIYSWDNSAQKLLNIIKKYNK